MKDAMKDYVVKIVRQGEILIRAASAEEAASMVAQFDSASWDNLELHIEVVCNEADRDGKNGKSLKYAIAKKNKKLRTCLEEYEIPF